MISRPITVAAERAIERNTVDVTTFSTTDSSWAAARRGAGPDLGSAEGEAEGAGAGAAAGVGAGAGADASGAFSFS